MTLGRTDDTCGARSLGLCLLGYSAVSLLFSAELLGQCNPKPTVYTLLEVIPQSITVGSGNTSVNLRLQYIAAGVTTLNPDGFAVNWQGMQSLSLPVSGITGPVNDVFSLAFTAPRALMTTAQQVTLSVIGVFCGEAVPGVSNTRPLSIVQPMPISITSLDPSRAPAGSPPFNITISGSGFTSDSRVRWNNLPRDTSFQSSSRLNVMILAQDVARTGTARIDVVNAVTGVQSNALTIEISNPQPFITGINPLSITAGTSGFTLTIDGTGFNADSRVRWNGTERATTLVSYNRLTAAILAVDIAFAGDARVTVFNPAPGGGQSNVFGMRVVGGTPDEPPAVFMTAPAEGSTVSGVIEVSAEATDDVGVVGVQFLVDGVVIGAEDRSAPYSILFDTSLMSLGSHEFSARARDASDNRATAAAVTATKVGNPNISNLNPSSALEGDRSFPLTVLGGNFTPKSVVLWNRSPRVTQFISSTHLVAKIPTNDIVSPGTSLVSVRDGNVLSDSLSFVVNVNNEPPVLTGVLPPFIAIEGNTRIRLLGRNFKASIVGNTQFLVGGKPVTRLTFVNSSEIDAIAPPNPEGLSEVVMVLPAGLETTYFDRLVSSQTSNVGLEYKPAPEVPPTKPGYKRLRVPFVIDTEQFRTNLGINNLGESEATVEILMSDSNGKLVFRRKSVKVPARGMTQCNRVIQLSEKAENESSTELNCTFGDLMPLTGREGYLLLESEQPFVAWASQIDNFTLDASMEQGLAESAAATRVVLPSSVTSGQFRTSLVVVNHSATTGQVQIRSRKAEDGTPQASVNRTLERYGHLFFEDFYKDAGLSDVFGPIELEATDGINITAAARIYTEQGTSGYLEGADLARASQNVLLPYSLDNLDFRTNLGITNPGETFAQVTVKLLNRNGQQEGIFSTMVAPHGMTQIDNINRRLLNTETVSNLDGYLLVEADRPVFGWTSQIDNLTQDLSMVVGKSGTASSSLLIPSTTNSGEYKSTLALVNPSGAPVTVQITARDEHGNTAGTSQAFLVVAQGMIVDPDIRKKLGSQEGFGPLELSSLANNSLLAVSRVYSTQRTGGYFEGIPIGP